MAFPHGLAYFNELVGGPMAGKNHLAEATSDWGQDLFYLRAWARAYAARERLLVSLNVPCAPSSLDLPVFDIPLKRNSAGESELGMKKDASAINEPDWYAVSTAFLQGGPRGIRTFRNLVPQARAGYSILIFRLPETSHIEK
jgi:hypothetical protein